MVPIEKAKELLKRQIEVLESLPAHREFPEYDKLPPAFQKWHRDTGVAIERIFGKDTRHLEDFDVIAFYPEVFYPNMARSDYSDIYHGGIERAREVLKSMVDELADFGFPSHLSANYPRTIRKVVEGYGSMLRKHESPQPQPIALRLLRLLL